MVAKVKSEDAWLRRLVGYIWRYKKIVLIASASSVAIAGIGVVVPLVQRSIIDSVIISGKGPVLPWAIALIGIALLNFVVSRTRRYLGGSIGIEVQNDLRTEVFDSLSRLDGRGQDNLETGQIVSRSSSDINMVSQLIGMAPMMAGTILMFFSSIVAMLFLSPALTLVGLAVGPGLLAVNILARRKLFPATWDSQQKTGALAGVVESAVTGVRVVKGFGQERQEVDKLDRAASTLFAARMRQVRLTARYNPTLGAIPTLGQIGILALGGWMALNGQITIGTFFAFSSYLAAFVGPVRMLTTLITFGQQVRASAIRVFEVIDSKPDIQDRPGAGSIPHEALDVEFRDVTFGYLASEPVLHGLDLSVRHGETMAVIGTSGSGKSTLAMLLPRFYDPQGGGVRIGGQDLRDVTTESVRASIGLVMEEAFLFSDSVRANIAYGAPNATDEQVRAAARAAEADRFIEELPDGYDTVVGEQGLTLSGGQRQRVALARALITDPQILLLDDATSAVDAATEAEIHATLHRVMENRTTLLIAHRRSTLQLADRIAVLDHGRLVAVGTAEELERDCPLYRLLLSGPGDDAEGVDAGELPVDNAMVQVDGVTPALWDHSKLPQYSESAQAAAAAANRVPQGGGGGGGGGGRNMIAALPATPELLAKVAALPPANDKPDLDKAAVTAPDYAFSLKRLLRPFLVVLVFGLLLESADALASLAIPALIRTGVDEGIQGAAYHVIAAMAIVGFCLVLADWVVEAIQTMVTGRMGERLLYTLRLKAFAHLQRLGLDFYEKEMAGRLMTRMTSDIDALSTFLQNGVSTTVVSILTFFGIAGALIVVNWRMSLVVFAVIPILIVATVIFKRRSSKAYSEARDRISAVNADLQENVAGMRVTQAFRREGVNRTRYAGKTDAYRVSRLRAQKYIATYFPFVQLLADLTAAFAIVYGAHLIHQGSMTAGALIAYLLYVDMFFAPVQNLSQVFDSYQQAAVGLRRITDLLRTRTNTPEREKPAPVTGLTGLIEFRDLRFGYTTSANPALGGRGEDAAGVNVVIDPGTTVALVGETGAGKSTMVKMVARYYDPTSGAVLVDGVDLRDYDLSEYRGRLGVVPQEAYLFPGTVAEAIAYGRPGASDAEIEAAARAVGAHEMVAKLSGGYLHQVGERGRSLSAGQRQLLALARAYLVDPDILLLDEATAALDLASEAAVTRAMDEVSRSRTTLVVAHRLTTAARADRILVLDGGLIVEDGTHDDLLAAEGAYARLWNSFMHASSEGAPQSA
ncbi:ABC transporter ATP-binding protein [Actinospica sp. MGRD01-02]|uniref:ABC transporter ATP-binding protein n=1 Tax=Actinospica acidithermotolerans TaxID=2828514 RepID=A0A941E9V9_9ACTN|nr:ABC transporter ATP-binding protein [Actinospica acidithermotolerans]MBR7826285.1 ABC transporter ATP-binding protein [Actinospica acidithermotolerans]